MKNLKQFFTLSLLASCIHVFSQIPLNTHNTESVLYLGKGKSQPLIAALGGSEGGNVWAGDY